MSRYWSKFCYLKGGSVTLNENFRGKGRPSPTIFGTRKVESLGYRMVKKKLPITSQTDDRQTTDKIAMASSEREREFTSAKNVDSSSASFW